MYSPMVPHVIEETLLCVLRCLVPGCSIVARGPNAIHLFAGQIEHVPDGAVIGINQLRVHIPIHEGGAIDASRLAGHEQLHQQAQAQEESQADAPARTHLVAHST